MRKCNHIFYRTVTLLLSRSNNCRSNIIYTANSRNHPDFVSDTDFSVRTLKSEENWNKTHRLGGFVFMICGVLILVSSWAGISWMTVVALFAMIIIPMVYSYILHRRGV